MFTKKSEKLLVALKGSSGQGKSGTLIALTNELLGLSQVTARFLDKPGRAWEGGVLPNNQDVFIKIEINGIVIGVASQGDPNTRLDEKLKELKDEQCDLIFCACRSRGGTRQSVQSFADNNNYDIVWTSPYYVSNKESDFSSINSLKANQMLELVRLIGYNI